MPSKQETGTFSPQSPSKAPSSGVLKASSPVPGDSIACPKIFKEKRIKMKNGLLIFSAPSGSGKSTIVNWLMKEHPELKLAFLSAAPLVLRAVQNRMVWSISSSPEEFKAKIEADEFLEYEEVYQDRFYGTLKSQVENQLAKGESVIFDVDVKGGVNIKKFYGERA